MSTPNSQQQSAPIIRLPELRALTGRGRSAIYADMAAGRLPRPIKLGARSVGWLRAEVDAWIAARIAERDAAKGC